MRYSQETKRTRSCINRRDKSHNKINCTLPSIQLTPTRNSKLNFEVIKARRKKIHQVVKLKRMERFIETEVVLRETKNGFYYECMLPILFHLNIGDKRLL